MISGDPKGGEANAGVQGGNHGVCDPGFLLSQEHSFLSARFTKLTAINQRLARESASGMIVADQTPRKRETMLSKIGRLFTIKTKLEAYLIIYALALGAVERGIVYLGQYPGLGR